MNLLHYAVIIVGLIGLTSLIISLVREHKNKY